MTAAEMAGRIEMWPLERLKPYAQNPRTHSAEQVNKIAASIQEFGFLNPILVDGDAGIIAGHGRLAAAQQVGLTEIPVIELTHLTELQRRAYRLADNRLALEAGWDDALLASELQELADADFDLPLTGFDARELARLLGDTQQDGGPEIVEFGEDRAVLRISCYEADAEKIEAALRRAVKTTRLAGVKITRV